MIGLCFVTYVWIEDGEFSVVNMVRLNSKKKKNGFQRNFVRFCLSCKYVRSFFLFSFLFSQLFFIYFFFSLTRNDEGQRVDEYSDKSNKENISISTWLRKHVGGSFTHYGRLNKSSVESSKHLLHRPSDVAQFIVHWIWLKLWSTFALSLDKYVEPKDATVRACQWHAIA